MEPSLHARTHTGARVYACACARARGRRASGFFQTSCAGSAGFNVAEIASTIARLQHRATIVGRKDAPANIGERARSLRAARNRHAKLSPIGVIPNLDGTILSATTRDSIHENASPVPRSGHALVRRRGEAAGNEAERDDDPLAPSFTRRSLARLSRIRARLNGRFGRDERVPPWGVSVTAGNSRRMSPVSGHADYVKV